MSKIQSTSAENALVLRKRAGMMRSVSMLARSRGAAIALTLT